MGVPHEISSVLDQFAEDISELRQKQEAVKNDAVPPTIQPASQANTEQLAQIEKRLTALEAVDHIGRIEYLADHISDLVDKDTLETLAQKVSALESNDQQDTINELNYRVSEIEDLGLSDLVAKVNDKLNAPSAPAVTQ